MGQQRGSNIWSREFSRFGPSDFFISDLESPIVLENYHFKIRREKERKTTLSHIPKLPIGHFIFIKARFCFSSHWVILLKSWKTGKMDQSSISDNKLLYLGWTSLTMIDPCLSQTLWVKTQRKISSSFCPELLTQKKVSSHEKWWCMGLKSHNK